MTDNEINKIIDKIDSLHRKILNSKFAEQVTESELLSLILAVHELTLQKAEVERLNAMVEAAEEHFSPLPFKNAFDDYIVKVTSEARKEFAEKVDKLLTEHSRGDIDDTELYRLFDNILEETEEENNGNIQS